MRIDLRRPAQVLHVFAGLTDEKEGLSAERNRMVKEIGLDDLAY